MKLKDRIKRSLKRESGLRLSPADVQALAEFAGIHFPIKQPSRCQRRIKKGDPVKPHIRWIIRRDMPEVIRIDSESFGSLSMDEREFISILRQRNCIGMVAEHKDAIAGFVIYELHKSRIEITRFAVSEKLRMRTIGTSIVQKLIGKLSLERRISVRIECCELWTGGLLFLQSQGFRATDLIARDYDPYDGVQMEYRLNGEKHDPESDDDLWREDEDEGNEFSTA